MRFHSYCLVAFLASLTVATPAWSQPETSDVPTTNDGVEQPGASTENTGESDGESTPVEDPSATVPAGIEDNQEQESHEANSTTRDDEAEDEVEAEGDENWPVSFAGRPLTMPQRTLRLDAGIGVNGVVGPDSVGAFANIGAGYGATDAFELGATVIPLTLAPDFNYRDLELYGLYTLATGFIEVGGLVAFSIPVETDFGLTLGVPIVIRIADRVRIDTGVLLDTIFGDFTPTGMNDSKFDWRIEFPAELIINATDHIYAGLGLSVRTDFDQLTMPLLLTLGYTVGSSQPVADLELVTGFEQFLAKAGGNSDIITESWILGLHMRLYIGL